MKYSIYGIVASAVLALASCEDAFEDNTGNVGIYDEADAVYTSSETYTVTTRSLPLDSVISSTTKSYFGEAYDPTTGVNVRAEFLSLYHTFENYRLPDTTLITSRLGDSLVCDSVVLRLYFNNYYGSDANPLKMAVYELDTLNVVREDSIYYSTIKLDEYRNPKRKDNQGNITPLIEKSFTATDYTVSEVRRANASYYKNVHIFMPRDYGTHLLRLIAKNPHYTRDSYQFAHHVCPGFYFSLMSGTGTILVVDVSTLDIFFKHISSGKEEVGLVRFSATPEVVQSTRITNTGVEAKAPVDSESKQPLAPTENATYVMAPAGIATEMTLPVDEIFAGHETDSISRANITLTRYNPKEESMFEAPTTLLMLRKSQQKVFFEKGKVPDDITSFAASFTAASNTYTFTNIGRLISYLYRTKQQVMRQNGWSSDEYNTNNPDWNKVVLSAVTMTKNKNTGSVVVVRPDFALSSAALVGGTQPLKMQVLYSSKAK